MLLFFLILLMLINLLIGVIIGWLLHLMTVVNAVTAIIAGWSSKIEDHHAVCAIADDLQISRRRAGFYLTVALRHYPGLRHTIIPTHNPIN